MEKTASRLKRTALALGLGLLAGFAIAELANQMILIPAGGSHGEALRNFASQPAGARVSVVESGSGAYITYERDQDGENWTEVSSGVAPEYASGGGGGGGDPGHPGGGGGSGGGSGPIGPSGCYGYCPNPEVGVGPIRPT